MLVVVVVLLLIPPLLPKISRPLVSGRGNGREDEVERRRYGLEQYERLQPVEGGGVEGGGRPNTVGSLPPLCVFFGCVAPIEREGGVRWRASRREIVGIGTRGKATMRGWGLGGYGRTGLYNSKKRQSPPVSSRPWRRARQQRFRSPPPPQRSSHHGRPSPLGPILGVKPPPPVNPPPPPPPSLALSSPLSILSLHRDPHGRQNITAPYDQYG